MDFRPRSSLAISDVLIRGYLLLSSIYALLAYIPYTFRFLIEDPPFDWLPWFARHNRALAAIALCILLVRLAIERRTTRRIAAGMSAVAAAILFALHPFTPIIVQRQYAIALGVLLPVAAAGLLEFSSILKRIKQDPDEHRLIAYAAVVLMSLAMAWLGEAGALFRMWEDKHQLSLHGRGANLIWVTVSEIWLALIIVSVMNLVILFAKGWNAGRIRALFGCSLLVAVTAISSSRLLHSMLDFTGLGAAGYTTIFGVAVGTWSTVVYLGAKGWMQRQSGLTGRYLYGAVLVAGCVGVVWLPTLIGDRDWNGVLSHAGTLTLSTLILFGASGLIGSRAKYSAAAILAILVVGGFTYGLMTRTSFIWGRALSDDPDTINTMIANHASQNSGFDFVYTALERPSVQRCGTLCRTLEAYCEIQHAHTNAKVELVESLTPTTGFRPNIFIIVMDSLRPDFLGAYNPQVDFTPTFDAFARDSVVVRKAYTQYMGTSLSEPTIWSGSLLLHSHYVQPIQNVNSLARLARTDGYQVVVSYDTIVRQLFGPEDHPVKLDLDKKWNGFELSSTVQEFEEWYDKAADHSQPILFYAQPMNVHQVGENDLPKRTSKNWVPRPVSNNRVAFQLNQADAFFQQFLNFLKARHLYDDSIIIFTSDHGDATGELGRIGHSLIIFPEVARVPMIIHLPKAMRETHTWDPEKLTALTDITPSLYYLLGHKPIVHNPIYGQPIFVRTRGELAEYPRTELFVESDARPLYGIIDQGGDRLFTVFDYPEHSELFDLKTDPHAVKNISTPEESGKDTARVLEWLKRISDFYGYKPAGG
jgi:arylsulfatase A-like enzyme